MADFALGTVEVSESGDDMRPTDSGELFNTVVGNDTDPAEQEAMLALERQRLALEREKLELERQRLALDAERVKLESDRLPKQGKKSSQRLKKSTSHRAKKATSHRAKKATSHRAKKATSHRAKKATSHRAKKATSRRTEKVAAEGTPAAEEEKVQGAASRRLHGIKSGGRGPGFVVFLIFATLVPAIGIGAYVISKQADPVIATSEGDAGETPEFAALREKAEDGDAEAMLSVGVFYWNGVGGQQDTGAAKKWFLRAAEDGNAEINARAVVYLEEVRQLEAAREKAEEWTREQEAERERDEASRERREALLRKRRAEEDAERRENARQERERQEAARAAEKQQSDSEITAIALETLDEVTLLIATNDPDKIAEGLELLKELENRYELTPDAKDQVTAARNGGLAQMSGLLGKAEQAAKKAFAEGDYTKAADVIEAVAQVISPLPPSLQAVWDDTDAKLEAIRLEQEKQKEAELAKQRQQYEATVKLREQEKSKFSRLVRDRASKWFSARASAELLCAKCKGHVQMVCTSCDGRGRENYFNGTKKCDKCKGTGKTDCTRCNSETRGYSSSGLRKAFWLSISPNARKGRSSKSFCEGLVHKRELGEVLGEESLLVHDSKIQTVEVLEDRARVTAELTYGEEDSFRSERTHVSEWIRGSGKFYVRTAADKTPEPLLTPLPNLASANKSALGPVQTVAEFGGALRKLYSKREELTDLAWKRHFEEFRVQAGKIHIADGGVVQEVQGNSRSVYVTVSVGSNMVILSFGSSNTERLVKLSKGDNLRFRGRLTQWRTGGRDRTEWQLDLEDVTLLD